MRRPPRFTLVCRHHPRRRRAARRMREAGWPVSAIARALAMTQARVRAVLAGTPLWDAAHINLFREVA